MGIVRDESSNNVIFYMFFYDIIWCYYFQPLRLLNFDSFEQQNTLKSASAWEDSCGFRRPFGDLVEAIRDGKAKVSNDFVVLMRNFKTDNENHVKEFTYPCGLLVTLTCSLFAHFSASKYSALLSHYQFARLEPESFSSSLLICFVRWFDLSH